MLATIWFFSFILQDPRPTKTKPVRHILNPEPKQ